MELWQRWIGYAISYATVLPGIFVTSDLMELLWGRVSSTCASECAAVSSKRQSIPSFLFIVSGLVLTAAPLIWPRYFFPAAWLGLIFLLDPLLERAGVQRLLLMSDPANRRRIYSLMLGGLFCGFLWEFWNYWAGSKWLYTLPFFGNWRVFEMPILGFLGFLPFALECWILYHLLRAISRRMDSLAVRIAWWTGLGILSLFIMHGIDRHTLN
jgi:hypothetical protein